MPLEVAVERIYVEKRKNDYLRYLGTLCYGNVTAALIVKLVGMYPCQLAMYVFTYGCLLLTTLFPNRSAPILLTLRCHVGQGRKFVYISKHSS